MGKVLVTGGAGRLGRSVVTALLDDGSEVLSVDRADAEVDARARTATVDLLEDGAFHALLERERPDAVVHLAAIAVPFSAPEAVITRVNTALAFSVMRAAADQGVARIVTASSPTVIGYGAPGGWAPSFLPLDETHPTRPWNAYSLSKLFAEQMATSLAAELGDRIATASFRPCYVIAPEEWDGAPTQQGHSVGDRLDDPALAAPSLFNYVDARDAGDFVAQLLSAMGSIENGLSYFVGASDAFAREPLAELLPRYGITTAADAAPLTGRAPAFSSARAERVIGWRPARSWRTELQPRTARNVA
ncbi:NAD(P)-dependent oxidoreductase [Rathayibacter sp. VKM Ac-2835]|uniref:NAD-dependent epimerase/dehydratase family protein n=1 Tax=Rathayibacter sp. VKM Ac-2835 TaxID=2739043 RepID=UPI001566A841|nr:NAD(P)-dependent oxidoreductase [Rathayibacter sp. VKM Ac-2835]NRG43038.1 NAD(P)-dependent oxidoreductase [Rathayibacter sp. VKM Ac-2835]